MSNRPNFDRPARFLTDRGFARQGAPSAPGRGRETWRHQPPAPQGRAVLIGNLRAWLKSSRDRKAALAAIADAEAGS